MGTNIPHQFHPDVSRTNFAIVILILIILVPANTVEFVVIYLFLSTPLNVVLRFQFSVDTKSVPTVVNDPHSFFVYETFNLPDFAIVGVYVEKFYLKCRVSFDEQNSLNIAILKGLIVAYVDHSQHRQH